MANLVYVDNSNVWIEGMHVAAVDRGTALDIWDAMNNKICDYDWSFDFGKLLDFAGGDRSEIKRAMLFGSRPPNNDSLWTAAKANGFEVVVYDRNAGNREKKIDTDVVATIMEDSFTIVDPKADEIILVAGDKDYVPLFDKLKTRGIKASICFWDHAATELKESASTFYSLNAYLNHLRR